MPSVCSFVLNKPNATYVGGEIISGNITLITTSEKNVKGKSTINKFTNVQHFLTISYSY